MKPHGSRETITVSTEKLNRGIIGRRGPPRTAASKNVVRVQADPSPTIMLPTTRFVTASSQEGRISHDGRSEGSSAWLGGAAYVQMCLTCGLEPSRPGKSSNCMCVCGLGALGGKSCSAPLRGHGDASGICRSCGGGRPEIHSIATTEVKAKRARVMRPSPAAAQAVAVVSSPVAVAANAVTAFVHPWQ